MGKWLVAEGDQQISVDGIEELKQMASNGTIGSNALVQPPDSFDWMRLGDVPEMAGILQDEFDDFSGKKGIQATHVAVALLIVVAVGLGFAYTFVMQLPTGQETLLGEGGLAYSEMLVTEAGASLQRTHEPSSPVLLPLEQNDRLELLSKRGDYYRARTQDGMEGWLPIDHVIPMYQLGGEDVRSDYDPLYNPDRYVTVANASWTLFPDKREELITVFQFLLKNQSKYAMTDIRLVAIIKDARGQELERVEIGVGGVIPPNKSTFVGTLSPEDKASEEEKQLLTSFTLDQMVEEDPDLQLQYSEGIDVKMSTPDFAHAEIEILELRAVPDSDSIGAVTKNR